VSLVGRVYLLVLLAAAPAFALQLYTDLEQRRAGEARINDEASRLVRFAAGELDKILEGARAFLLAVAAHPSVRSLDAAGCNEYLAAMRMTPQPFRGAFLVDVRGNILCATWPDQGSDNVADRSYFKLALTTRRFSVGDLVASRVDNLHSLPVGLPIVSPSGQVEAVVVMGISAEALEATFKDKAWPPGGSISIIDRTGTIAVRWPSPELVGQRIPEAFAWMLNAPGEGTTTGVGPDGIERIGAFVPPAANKGLLVSVALSKSAALAPLDFALRRDLILLGACALLTFAAAALGGRHFISRPVQRLSDAVARLRGGDLAARAELPDRASELGRLGAAFDEMAAAIEVRERDVRRSEELFRQFAENLPEVVWVEDVASGRIEYVGPAFARIWGQDPDAVRTGDVRWLDRVQQEDRRHLLAALSSARMGTTAVAEYRITRPDGEQRWLHSTAFPIRDPDGTVVRIARISRDITATRALEAEREQALRQRDLLFSELNHRIKNNLQIVRSLLFLQSGQVADPAAKEALRGAGQRIAAVGEMHALLYRGGSIGDLDLAAYLEELCRSLGEAMIGEPGQVTIATSCASCRIDMDRAILLGLIVSELVTNSLKYAFAAEAPGLVRVSLERVGEDRVRLTVADNGTGFGEGTGPEGFGLRIVKMLAQQLDAELSLSSGDGVRAELEFHLPPLPQHQAAA
jgi:PAS domain S-box-containing protein